MALKATHEVPSPVWQCLVNTGTLLGWLSSEALNKKLSKEASGVTHQIYGDMSVVMITIFVYFLLAKLSVSCQYLKSSHSGNPTFTKRT